MKFNDYKYILSNERLNRYLVACNGDSRKAMSLYRLNLNLSQKTFTLLSCLEIALRNAIDRELSNRFGNDWLRDSILSGGFLDIRSCHDSAKIITKAYNRLHRHGEYSRFKLLAEMEFGIWKYMFAKPQYKASGQCLLHVFPSKPKSSANAKYDNSYIFNKLDGINILRNRIAHHEPICFAHRMPEISTAYIRNAYNSIIQLFEWMNIDHHSFLYGLDHVLHTCNEIDSFKNRLTN